jgi:hypothetical protein
MGRPRIYPTHTARTRAWRQEQKQLGRCAYCAKKAEWSLRLVRRLLTCETHRLVAVQREQAKRDRLKAAA